MASRTLRAAAVQMPYCNGDIEGNLAGALAHVAAAAREGAKLILLPELLAAGYIYTPAFWDAGETDTMGSHLNGLLPRSILSQSG